jgi:hypothetical protein
MRRITLPVAGLLAVGLLVGGYVVERAAGQSTAASRTLPTWPPPPQLMVDRQGSATVSGFTYQTILDVPNGYWFVLTDFSFPASSPYNATAFQLGEEFGAAFTVRADFSKFQWLGTSDCRFQSATGIAFQPGSKVKIYNTIGSVYASWNIVGYLVPK